MKLNRWVYAFAGVVTLLLAGGAAVLFPIPEKGGEEHEG